MSGLPFIICSWKENFLTHLVGHALERTSGSLSEACFIFPHGRPARYIAEILKQDPRVRRPLIMPSMYAVTELFASLSRIMSRESLWQAGILDRVGLLLEVVRNQNIGNEGCPEFPAHDARFFYPWGLRLAALFEECLAHGRAPANLPHAEDQALPFAVALLEKLSFIFQGYLAGLEKRGWTTPGLDAYRAAKHLEETGNLPNGFLHGKKIILAGFHALTGTEDTLFQHLWQREGASVILHADPNLIEGQQHWSCDALHDWAKAWGARLVQAPPLGGKESAPVVRFYEGYDLHSQLTGLKGQLERRGTPAPGTETPFAADTAVILPESGLLMPVLHHLPATEVNISMGYPLARSSLFRLLDTLLCLQENKREEGYYWRDVLNLIRHPYIKMLGPANDAASGGERPNLRRELHAFEQALRRGSAAYIQPRELLDALAAGETDGGVFTDAPQQRAPRREQTLSATNLNLTTEIFRCCLDGFAGPATPAGLAQALEAVCRLLLTYGGDLWERFPIDAECLYRLLQSLIPELARSALSHELLGIKTLCALARQMMNSERVPFEASPLVGLQVLGMLETRLLTFRKLIVLEATEDLLPGAPPADPLLPESLRPALGLPASRTREQVAAYTFFRLLAGAEEAHLFWQEGGDAKGLEDRKKKKSRFVEELLWLEEQKAGRLFGHKESSGPLSVLSCAIAALPQARRALPRTRQVNRLMQRFLEGPISATALDDYLQCPARFLQTRLLRLAPADEPDTGEGPQAVGLFLHQVLQDFYQEILERDLPAGPDLPKHFESDMRETFKAHLAHASLKRILPADAFAMLAAAGEERLIRYLRNQPATRVLGLEKKLTARFEAPGAGAAPFTLVGTLDRLDIRENGPIILDYKTSTRLKPIKHKVWEDSLFWGMLRNWQPGEAAASRPDPVLAEAARRIPSVQLPFYLLLHRLATGEDAANAAWVRLADDGQEVPLFDKKISEPTYTSAILNYIPELIAFLLRHMLLSPCFHPQAGPHCDWCSVQASCMVATTTDDNQGN